MLLGHGLGQVKSQIVKVDMTVQGVRSFPFLLENLCSLLGKMLMMITWLSRREETLKWEVVRMVSMLTIPSG